MSDLDLIGWSSKGMGEQRVKKKGLYLFFFPTKHKLKYLSQSIMASTWWVIIEFWNTKNFHICNSWKKKSSWFLIGWRGQTSQRIFLKWTWIDVWTRGVPDVGWFLFLIVNLYFYFVVLFLAFLDEFLFPLVFNIHVDVLFEE